jgi:hypothetical protein
MVCQSGTTTQVIIVGPFYFTKNLHDIWPFALEKAPPRDRLNPTMNALLIAGSDRFS